MSAVQGQQQVGVPVVAVDRLSARAWMQAADVVIGHHRSARSARRWMNTIHDRYPGCTLAISRHPSGRWCLVGVAGFRGRFATVRSTHSARLPAAEELGRVVFQAWVLWQIVCAVRRSDGQGRRS